MLFPAAPCRVCPPHRTNHDAGATGRLQRWLQVQPIYQFGAFPGGYQVLTAVVYLLPGISLLDEAELWQKGLA